MESSLKTIEKNDENGGQPEILAQVHAIERTITVHCEDSDKGTVFGEVFNDCSCTDILYYPGKRDDITCYLREQHC